MGKMVLSLGSEGEWWFWDSSHPPLLPHRLPPLPPRRRVVVKDTSHPLLLPHRLPPLPHTKPSKPTACSNEFPFDSMSFDTLALISGVILWAS